VLWLSEPWASDSYLGDSFIYIWPFFEGRQSNLRHLLAMPYTEPASLTGKPFVILGAGTLGRRIALMWLTQGETVHVV
jgi:hypothetical protein